MRSRPRHSIAFFASAVAHASVLVWGTLTFLPEIDLPELEIDWMEVEVLDPDALQGDVEEPEPEPAVVAPDQGPAPPPEGEEPGDAKEQEDNPEEPKRNLGDKRSKVDKLAPESATFYALLVPKRIRKLEFREEAMDIMAPMPDFDFLITKGGFDPLRDFDHLVIASPNIRDPRQTFLAVDYRISREEMKRGIERAARVDGQEIDWKSQGDILYGEAKPTDPDTKDWDPRVFVLLEKKIAVYVRKEFLTHILAEDAGTEKTAGNYVANLTKLRRFAARVPSAGLQLKVKNLRRAARGVRKRSGLELPNDIELLAEARNKPELFVRFVFDDVVAAKKGANLWDNELKQLADKAMVGAIHEQIDMTREGNEVRLWSRFQTSQARVILNMLASQSARMVKSSEEQTQKAREQRLENWKKRKGGKLPPSALEPEKNNKPEPTPKPDPGTAPPPQPPAEGGPPPTEDPPAPPAKAAQGA